MQELNMYRSLLLQQIGTIKMLCANKEESQVIFIRLLIADKCAYSLLALHTCSSNAITMENVCKNKFEIYHGLYNLEKVLNFSGCLEKFLKST